MPQIFHLKSTDTETGAQNIVVFVQGMAPQACDDSHPNFDAIVALANDIGNTDVEDLLDLFDVAETVSKRFEKLTERVSIANGRVYFDGDEVNNALSNQIIRFMDEGVDDWMPLVEFFENVASNPQEHSRTQLFEWLDRHQFTIDEDGYMIAYKGVTSDLKSIHSGPGIVTRPGEDPSNENGRLDNSVGNIIEMARSNVQHDPSVGCHTGLHVGTYSYAQGFAQGAVLKVRVNPRDVVSVPTDCSAQKVRTCRYEVIEKIDAPHTSAFAATHADNDWQEDLYDEDDYCDDCGDDYDDCEC